MQQFMTRLRQAAKDCAFDADIGNQIRDAVLRKCTSDYVRRKLLEEPQLTLPHALEIADGGQRGEERDCDPSVQKGGEIPEVETTAPVEIEEKDKRNPTKCATDVALETIGPRILHVLQRDRRPESAMEKTTTKKYANPKIKIDSM